MENIWVLLSYFLPIGVLVWSRTPVISPLWICVVFYFAEFGPQTFMEDMLRYAAYQPEFYQSRFHRALILANVAMAAGIVVCAPFLRRAIQQFDGGTYRHDVLITFKGRAFFVIAIAVYCVIFLATDGVELPRLREHIAYLLGRTASTYADIRRELFSGTPVETLMAYTRQSTSALLVATSMIYVLKTNNLTYVALIFVLYICCFLQLNKFPLLYIFVVIFIATYIYKTQRINPRPRDVGLFAGTIALLLFVLLVLYQIQYRAQLNTGAVNYDDLTETIIYRPFFNQADTLRLWFEEFPERTPFLGVSNISLLAPLFGLEFVDVTKLIPDKYVAPDLTTFQAGFIGSGYASFGYLGIFLYGMIVTMLASLATVTYLRIKPSDLRAVFGSVIMLNMYFFFSRELSTALLSGGIIPVILIGMLFRSVPLPQPEAGGEQRYGQVVQA